MLAEPTPAGSPGRGLTPCPPCPPRASLSSTACGASPGDAGRGGWAGSGWGISEVFSNQNVSLGHTGNYSGALWVSAPIPTAPCCGNLCQGCNTLHTGLQLVTIN